MTTRVLAPQILVKTEDELRRYQFEFAKELASSDTFTGVQVITATPSGLTIGTVTDSGSVVQAPISVGVNGTDYTVKCKATTTGGDTLEMQGTLAVRKS